MPPAPPLVAPPVTRADAERELLTALDLVWAHDTPRTLHLLEEFVARFSSDSVVDEKLYASLVARASDLAESGQIDAAATLMARAELLLGERLEPPIGRLLPRLR